MSEKSLEEVTTDRAIHIRKGVYTNPLLASAIAATEQQTTGQIKGTASRRLRIAVGIDKQNNDKTK